MNHEIIDILLLKIQENDYDAFIAFLEMTKQKVPWAAQYWPIFVEQLASKNDHERSRAAQMLCHLAMSMDAASIQTVLDPLWQIAFDKKFVVSRHLIQTFWRVALHEDFPTPVVARYTEYFKSCEQQKNYTLIRYDIVAALRKLLPTHPVLTEFVPALIELEQVKNIKRNIQKLGNNGIQNAS